MLSVDIFGFLIFLLVTVLRLSFARSSIGTGISLDKVNNNVTKLSLRMIPQQSMVPLHKKKKDRPQSDNSRPPQYVFNFYDHVIFDTSALDKSKEQFKPEFEDEHYIDSNSDSGDVSQIEIGASQYSEVQKPIDFLEEDNNGESLIKEFDDSKDDGNVQEGPPNCPNDYRIKYDYQIINGKKYKLTWRYC